MFGQDTRPIDDFLPRLKATIGAIDSDMARTYLMDAVITFCRESQLVRRVECFPIENCVLSYRLSKLRINERLSEVMSVKLYHNGKKLGYVPLYYVEQGVIYFQALPTVLSVQVEVEYTVVPKRDTELVYDVLYEDWLEPILNLTLSHLYLLSDMDWYDPKLSTYHKQLYEQQTRASRTHIISKHRQLKFKLSPKWSDR